MRFFGGEIILGVIVIGSLVMSAQAVLADVASSTSYQLQDSFSVLGGPTASSANYTGPSGSGTTSITTLISRLFSGVNNNGRTVHYSEPSPNTRADVQAPVEPVPASRSTFPETPASVPGTPLSTPSRTVPPSPSLGSGGSVISSRSAQVAGPPSATTRPEFIPTRAPTPARQEIISAPAHSSSQNTGQPSESSQSSGLGLAPGSRAISEDKISVVQHVQALIDRIHAQAPRWVDQARIHVQVFATRTRETLQRSGTTVAATVHAVALGVRGQVQGIITTTATAIQQSAQQTAIWFTKIIHWIQSTLKTSQASGRRAFARVQQWMAPAALFAKTVVGETMIPYQR